MPRFALAAAIALVLLLTTWPTHRFVGHSHWDRVEWMPFSRFIAPVDLVANLVVFLPLGFAATRRGWRFHRVVALGASLSVGAELYQVYCHAFPTVTDILANTSGTALGAALAVRVGVKQPG